MNVPASYKKGDPLPQNTSDTYHQDKAAAIANAKARDGGDAVVLDESESG